MVLLPPARWCEVLVSGFLNRAQVRGGAMDWKTSLLELCNAHGLGSPNYEVEGFGPDHSRRFRASAHVGERELGQRGGLLEEGCGAGGR